MKESLILYNSLGKVLRVISAEQCQRLMLAIFDLNETGVEADLSDDPVLNAVWIIQDALNNVAYKDDSQIYSAYVLKFYAECPGVKIRMTVGGEHE